MSRIERAIEDLRESFFAADYPSEFLEEYDQLECLAHSHGTETFLVSRRDNGTLFVAKYYEKSIFETVNESNILSAIHFEGLPAYTATFENDRVLLTVREYIEGTPLDQYAEEDKLSEKQAVAFCIQLCDILSYLHGQEKPVIHRDIKPQNIIVRKDGTIALIDFDIARQYREDAETDTKCFGTRVYAPPEQYGFSQTDCRADIYSLGVLLRYLLTGSEKEQAEKPLPKPMKRVVDRCTAFSPKDRFTSAEAVKRALLLSDGRHKQKRILLHTCAATALLFLCIGFALGRFTALLIPAPVAGMVAFKEPLIEAAARVQLGKTNEEPITAKELETIKELYIFGTEVSATRESFENALADSDRYTRGGITTLEDLALMPNIEQLQISYQDLTDTTGISALKHPISVNLMHTQITDVSELTGKLTLLSRILYGTNVTDVSCLDTCRRLEYLELGHTFVDSPAACGGFASVKELSLTGLNWNTLDGLERYTALETLNLTDARIGSIDALQSLATIRVIRSNGELYEKLKVLFENTGVSIIQEIQ